MAKENLSNLQKFTQLVSSETKIHGQKVSLQSSSFLPVLSHLSVIRN